MSDYADEDRARALLDLSIALIDAALDILEGHIKEDDQLTKESVLMPGGTVGKHFRHVIEMFQAFLLPLNPSQTSSSSSSQQGAIEINYDAMLPSSRRSVARSITSCRQAMKDVRNGLLEWERSVQTSIPSAITQLDSSGGIEIPGSGVAGETRQGALAGEMERKVRLIAVTPTRQIMESSIGREALDLPAEFGTAPSTLLYRKQDWTPPIERKEVRVVKSKL